MNPSVGDSFVRVSPIVENDECPEGSGDSLYVRLFEAADQERGNITF